MLRANHNNHAIAIDFLQATDLCLCCWIRKCANEKALVGVAEKEGHEEGQCKEHSQHKRPTLYIHIDGLRDQYTQHIQANR